MPINPKGAMRPIPLSRITRNAYALVNCSRVGNDGNIENSVLLFPVMSMGAQRKLGYFCAWCVVSQISVRIDHMNEVVAQGLLPSNCLHLPSRNFIILRNSPIMDDYKDHLQNTLDIRVHMTHTDDNDE